MPSPGGEEGGGEGEEEREGGREGGREIKVGERRERKRHSTEVQQ